MKRLVAVCLLLATPLMAQAQEKPAPYMLMRALQDMQNQIATGDEAAQKGQGALVADIGPEFERAPREVWSEPRNIRALAIYLFSGGTPTPVRRLFNAGVVPTESINLIRGALAYAEGRQGEARDFLLALDPMAVPASFGAHLALIQGALLARDAPEKSIAALDVARLLAPGGLIEETALRRAVFVAAQAGDLDAFCALAARYLRRFPRSVYASDFRGRLPIAIATFSPKLIESTFARIASLIEALEPEQKLETYLVVARAAALMGNPAVAASAARLAAPLAPPGSPERARADIYRVAAALRGTDVDAAISSLSSLNDRSLSAQDRELLAAARMVAAALRPDFGKSISLAPEKRPDPTELMQVASRVLSESDRLLQGSPR